MEDMVVGLLKVKLYMPSVRSLKDKRKILRSLKEKIRNKFNVSIAEVDYQDYHQSALLGIAQVASDTSYLQSSLERICSLIRQNPEIAFVHTEIEHF